MKTLFEVANPIGWTKYYDELHSVNERACAIVGAIMLENALNELLLKNGTNWKSLKSLELSKKIKLSHKRKLITDSEKIDFIEIAKIRNLFAHKLDTSFEDKKIKIICENFRPYYQRFVSENNGSSRKLFETLIGISIYSLSLKSMNVANPLATVKKVYLEFGIFPELYNNFDVCVSNI